MWRNKKLVIVTALVAAVLLVGGIGGVVYAQAKNRVDDQIGVTLASDNASQPKTLLARVAAILGIEQQKVEDAFAQARSETQDEALDNHLKNLVDQGKITQEQADQYKAWVKSKPDMTQYEQQLRDWQNTRPDIPLPLPGGFDGFGGRGFRGGMR
jgi:hypothetical protein